MSDSALNSSKILLDISRGYSILKTKTGVYYFKHPNNFESLQTEEFYEIAYQRAIKRGISSEDQLLERHTKLGNWSTAKEDKIKTLKWMIDKSEKACQDITDNTQRKVFENQINSQKKELSVLKDERQKLVGYSAESWASQQRMFKMIEDHIFEDKDFKKSVSIESNIAVIVDMHEKSNQLSSKNGLLAAAFDPSFFEIFSVQSHNPLSIFGVDFFSITIFQRYLLSYAAVLLNKLKNVDMPDEVKSDPVKIFDFNANSKNKESKVSHGVDDLKNTLKNKGKITAEDLIK